MNFSDLFVIFLSLFGYGAADQFVTCGSITKLYNPHYRVRLHSHDVKYGSGSGQQSVTGSPTQEDHNSNWLVKGTPAKPCTRGEAIKCGEQVRLEHVSTHRNLHSHHFSSPLSDQQEVSAFGEEGEGDTGDVWSIICSGEAWRRGDQIMLRHVDTDVYLGVTGQQYGRPINGQSEVVGLTRSGPQTNWQSMEGVFVQRSELPVPSSHPHAEL
ncbi:stromal cell-derived factor 2 [Hyalella azteca]|uniref:Stromal cell-derived factor 2 n=1 Tax=Hyalella azteca TaxID=294128 RepID=A0A8B7NG29_HYAAZ|nr:stromal cell-derived factor 2 [Hyalella azteca]